jgi:hypothetical protein
MFVNDLFKKKLNEGKANIDVPEIPRAPVPKPPKEKGVAEDFDDTHPYDSYVSAKRTVTSTGGNDKLSDKTASLDTDRFGNQRVRAVDGDKLTINTNIPKGVNVKMIPQQGAADIDEGSVQNKLHRRHQELRKKSGLPDPDYYKELKASYDIEDDAKRIAAQAEIKKKYRVAEGDTLDTGPDGKLTTKGEEQMRRYRQQKREQERQQIIAKHTKTVKGDTYGVAPSRISQSRNEVNWAAANKELRKKGLDEQGVAEGVERYLEEMRRAGYDIVTEAATLCPECGGPAYNNQMLAEKQDACYHKVKSRYKVWPSAYASGALVRCRKKGAKNWGNKSKK